MGQLIWFIGASSMRQAEVFLKGEGDEWYERNRDAELNPIVVSSIVTSNIRPASVLEVGCGNGRYLGELHRLYRAINQEPIRTLGIDPSSKAIKEARKNYPGIKFRVDDASEGLNFECGNQTHYDLIIFGFCLYLLDRTDLFYVVAASDAILNDGGYIAIHDFDTLRPHKVPYKHKDGIFSYKMDHSQLWLSNPAYTWVNRTKTGDGQSITIIRKTGWP